jgi:hypothetical protein
VALLMTMATTGALAQRPSDQKLPEPHPDLPDEFRQLLPRGGIPAVFAPMFVPAGEAQIDDDAWVLGVVIDGQAHAYSLNLLNHHEIVNDKIGDVAFAAVW